MSHHYPNQYVADIAEMAKEHGVAVVGVIDAFSYTAGLESGLNHPEIIIAVPLSAKIAHALLMSVYSKIQGGEVVEPDRKYMDVLGGNMPVVFKLADDAKTEEYTTAAHAMLQADQGRRARVYQMVLPDKQGLLPWDEGYSSAFPQEILYPTIN